MNATKQRYLKELEAANAVIIKDGALVKHDDGFMGIDPTLTKLPQSFLDYYSRLLSVGYANSYI